MHNYLWWCTIAQQPNFWLFLYHCSILFSIDGREMSARVMDSKSMVKKEKERLIQDRDMSARVMDSISMVKKEKERLIQIGKDQRSFLFVLSS